MNNQLMFSSEDMTWETPLYFFNKLNLEFNFTLDVCCVPETAKCVNYFTPEDDGLSQDWGNNTCWMNPPYGRDIIRWMKKAYEASLKGALVVCLVPARTDTEWFQTYAMRAEEIRFVKGRLKFGNNGEAINSAPFPSAIVIFNRYVNRPLHITTYDKSYVCPFKYNEQIEPFQFMQ